MRTQNRKSRARKPQQCSDGVRRSLSYKFKRHQRYATVRR